MVNQEEIDAVALYVEAAEELRNEHFFSEDEHIILSGINPSCPFPEQATFGLPEHLKSALAPFRRLWMRTELTHFGKVHGILCRECPEEPLRNYIKSLGRAFREAKRRWSVPPGLATTAIKPEGIIDIWLNTRFAHVGSSARAGEFERQDFDKLQASIGAARFEFLFRLTVREIGVIFINLLPVAMAALAYWKEREGKAPSVSIATPFGGHGTQKAADGSWISRNAPTQETLDQKLQRLLKRQRFDHLRTFIELLLPRCHEEDVKLCLSARTVVDCETIQVLMDRLQIDIENLEGMPAAGSFEAGTTFAASPGGSIISAYRMRDGKIAVTKDGIPFFGQMYAQLRQLLLDGSV
jgi:hypothetical protein